MCECGKLFGLLEGHQKQIKTQLLTLYSNANYVSHSNLLLLIAFHPSQRRLQRLLLFTLNVLLLSVCTLIVG